MKLRRNARRHEAGVDPTIWHEFAPGDRVVTSEGLAGYVVAVEDGPLAGYEHYVVELDGGLGGGDYSPGELRKIGSLGKTASKDEEEEIEPKVASEDYPELAEILVERPPLPHSTPVSIRSSVEASKTASYVVVDDGGDIAAGPFESRVRAEEELRALQEEDKGFGYVIQRVSKREANWLLDKFDEYVMEPMADRMIAAQPENIRYDPNTGRMPSYDWCRFRRDRQCYFPNQIDVDATMQAGYAVWVPVDRGLCPRDSWDKQRECPVSQPGPNAPPGENKNYTDATWAWSQGGQRYDEYSRPIPVHRFAKADNGIEVDRSVEDIGQPGGDDTIEDLSNMLEEYRQQEDNPYSGANPYMAAQADPEFRFHVTAKWADVRDKAKRIREAGQVRIISYSPAYLVGEVRGDTNIYQATLTREPGTNRVAMWECGCAWAAYSWGRSGRWKKYEGRMCSHALALNYEAQSRGWGGGEVIEDRELPKWRSDPSITVKVPGDYKRPEAGEWRLSSAQEDIAESIIEIRSECGISDRGSLGYCTPVAKKVEERLGYPMERGIYGGSLHAWNILPDGSIIDATADQFGGEYPFAIVTRSSPNWHYYRPFGQEQWDWTDAYREENYGRDPSVEDYYLDEDFPMPQPKASKVARKEPFIVKLRGQLVEVVEFLDNGLAVLRNGGTALISDLVHPLFHPWLGLTASKKTADADSEDGCMVAIRPSGPVLDAVHIEDGEDYENLHVTLLYLGKAADLDTEALERVVDAWTARWAPLTGNLSGYGVFDNDEPVLYASVSAPGLETAREDLIAMLAAEGIVGADDYGFQPHMTLAYGQAEVPGPLPEAAKEDFTISGAYVAYGQDWHFFPFGGVPSVQIEGSKTASLKSDIERLRSQLAQAAQEEYDAWDQDEDGMDAWKGSGGICDDISARMSSIISDNISQDIAILDGGQDGDDHAWLVVVDHDSQEAVGVDIPPGVYETGGGYSWKKIPGVVFTPNVVDIWDADYDLVADYADFDDFYTYGSREAELKDEPEGALPEVTAEEEEAEEAASDFVGETTEVADDPEIGAPAAIVNEDPALVGEVIETGEQPEGDDKLAWLMKDAGHKTADNAEIAQAAKEYLSKLSLKDFTPAEQKMLIDEGEGVVAANLDRLDLSGTHYEALEAALQAEEDEDDGWLL